MNLLKKQVIGLLGLSLLVACSQGAKEGEISLIADSQNIVSTRGSDEDQFFVLIKLKSPSLLERSSRINGVTVIDKSLKAKIEAEQAQAIANLKKISSDVQVVYRYKMVLNGLAVVGPKEAFDKINQVGLVANWEKAGEFQREVIMADETNASIIPNLKAHNSAKFIGAEQLNKQGITGKGIKVGVIDTGIDYTHAMFGGAGTEESYKAVNPALPNAGFPSAKVVGGIDLVGTEYSAGALEFAQTIPKPDLNPLDEAGHGSHVAGSIAGRGDGNVKSYDGMAPEASLYAIKVFGANGSTSDMVVIAGLEYAADPNGDGVLNDQLDIVNLSLGSGYGTPKLLYAEAVKNLVNGGTSAIISAGNSGNADYIVGSPSTSTEALSVAATLDDTEHTWIFASSKIKIGAENVYVEALEAATTKPITEAPIVGNFYYIGVADKDLTPDQAAALNGKVALIDRGVVNFNDKIKRAAAAGATGVVMANNAPTPIIVMGTTDKFNIPAIMVPLEIGNKIKAAMAASAAVSIEFLGDKNIEKPELIDTIASFSSKGPRSIDGYLKPEISAPGYSIISADVGTGDKMVQMSGTSMASPHMAGVMALLKQGLKGRGLDLTPLEMKNIAMGNAKTISENGKVYPISRQGAGRVEATLKTINSPIVASEPSLSFGEVGVDTKKVFTKAVKLRNIAKKNLALSFVFEGHPGVKLSVKNLSLLADKAQSVTFSIQLDASKATKIIEEFDGIVKIMEAGKEVYRLPLLAVVHKNSDISITSKLQPIPNKLHVTLKNKAANEGQALLFNAIAVDDRKKTPENGQNIFNTDCDIQAAGYRVVDQKNEDGTTSKMLQFAVKTFKPMTSWVRCDVSVLFDHNKDGKFDQELVGTNLASIPGQEVPQMASILLDAEVARNIRKSFEAEMKAAKGDPKKMAEVAESENYTPAIMDLQPMAPYRNSTLVLLQADISALAVDAQNNLNFKILTSYYSGSTTEFDDYLKKGKEVEGSYSISADETNHPFYGFLDDESSVLSPLAQAEVVLNKGKTAGQVIGFYPQNDFTLLDSVTDKQMQLLK